MERFGVAFDASEHRNIVVPSNIFYDESKEYRILVDSAFGKAEVRLAFGQKIEFTDSDYSDESEDKERGATAGTQDSEETEPKSISPDRGKTIFEEQEEIEEIMEKRRKKSFWPSFVDDSSFLTRCNQNYLCKEEFCNDMNKNLILNLMGWKDLLLSLVEDVKNKYPFGDESCKEQVAMVALFGDICNSIAASGLPVFMMGARQMLRHLDYPQTIQEAKLVEDIAEFSRFEMTAHMLPCHTTFFIVTTYSKRDIKKHVIYGVFPRYQPKEPCPVESMVLRSSRGHVE